jgi:catechol 2,3-dioxygenase-like lactoylglutathione lyase family enzyme
VIDHIGFEVADLGRTTAFYDPVFFALGGRRMVDSERAVAYGINAPVVWFTMRGIGPENGYGHVALRASGKVAVDAAHAAGLAHGGAEQGPPGAQASVRSPLLRGVPDRPGRASGRVRRTLTRAVREATAAVG